MKHFLLLILITLTALHAKAQLPVAESAPPDTTTGNSVVTIYCCGTGITKEWWNAADAHSWNNSSGFWNPELVASLYKEQQASDNSLKYIVDGVGTGVEVPIYDMIALGFPSMRSNPRGWRVCMKEAKDDVDDALKKLTGTVTLNLVGFSRGGVLAMWLASELEREKRIGAINLLLFDPVPGDTKVPEKIYSIGKKVKNYVGIYSSDERTWMFEPVIPAFESAETNVWMLRVPGSHETMVGNIQKDGHSIDYLTVAEVFVPDLFYVGWTTKVMVVETMKTKGWGNLSYTWNWHEDGATTEQRKHSFVERYTTMLNYKHYDIMRTVPFIPMSIQAYWNSPERGHSCLRCTLADIAEKRYNNQRCVYLMRDGKHLEIVGLEDYIKAPTAEEAWGKLVEIQEKSK